MRKIKVLCVDDSALIRSMISKIVNEQADMEMVATAPNPLIARDLIKQLNPDVLTLDVEMPHMDGLDFLERLMRLRPMPVIMVSSLTTKGSEITLNALELGAVDFVTKPEMRVQNGLAHYAEAITEKIRIAAAVKINRREKNLPPPVLAGGPLAGREKIIAIGASTGGTEALRRVLISLPTTCPGIVIAQHMPPGFTRSFAERLNSLCHISVKEAEEGDRIQPGHAYIAPGDYHMELMRCSGHYQIALNQRSHVNRHRPSVDVLFDSVAKAASRNATGVILTGMGNDGARGLLAMYNAGAHTVAQSERSCVVFGMPREAIELNAAINIVDLDKISQHMLTLATGPVRR